MSGSYSFLTYIAYEICQTHMKVEKYLGESRPDDYTNIFKNGQNSFILNSYMCLVIPLHHDLFVFLSPTD